MLVLQLCAALTLPFYETTPSRTRPPLPETLSLNLLCLLAVLSPLSCRSLASFCSSNLRTTSALPHCDPTAAVAQLDIDINGNNTAPGSDQSEQQQTHQWFSSRRLRRSTPLM